MAGRRTGGVDAGAARGGDRVAASWTSRPRAQRSRPACHRAARARPARTSPQAECALKLTWVLGAAFALTWAGESLLALRLGQRAWRASSGRRWRCSSTRTRCGAPALALSLLAGVVLLGGAPFHFWPGDLFQGARAHGWRRCRRDAADRGRGVAACAGSTASRRFRGRGAAGARRCSRSPRPWRSPAARRRSAGQRRPERRVGTLASLQGGLVLASLAASPTHEPFAAHGGLSAWAAHLALALTGAGALSRFLPASSGPAERPARCCSAAIRGAARPAATPCCRSPARPARPACTCGWTSRARWPTTATPGCCSALALAWLAAFGVSANEIRRAFGAPDGSPAPGRVVPRSLRAALWTACGSLTVLLWAWRGRASARFGVRRDRRGTKFPSAPADVCPILQLPARLPRRRLSSYDRE